MALAMEALEYNDTVFINAPYTREVRTPGYMENLRQELLQKKGAELVVVWVLCDKEVCRQRMIRRNSDRDTWKLENWMSTSVSRISRFRKELRTYSCLIIRRMIPLKSPLKRQRNI